MRWFRRIAVAAGATGALGVAILTFAVPAGAGGGGHCSGFAHSTTISMSDFCFQGSAHFVPAGATVTVRNDGETEHDIRAVDGSFSSGQLANGDTFEFAAPERGVVEFFCSLHGSPEGGGMSGVLIAGDSAGDSADDAEAVAAVAGTSATRPMVGTASSDPDAALVIGSVALLVAVLAVAGLGGMVLARYMRSERA